MVCRFVIPILIDQTREYGFNVPAFCATAAEPGSLVLAVVINTNNQGACGVAQFVQSADNLLYLGSLVLIFVASGQSHRVEKDGYQINPIFVFHFRRVTLHEFNQRVWAVIEQIWFVGIPGKWNLGPVPKLHLLAERILEG